jgi:hypothetical protein
MQVYGFTDVDHSMIDALIDDVRISVPNDMRNRHRQMIAEWEMAGHVIPDFVPVLEPSGPYRISKTTPWLRMTDEEAAAMDAQMSQTDARLKQIYMAATYLSSDDPLWVTLRQMLSDQFGEDRADELLAPET